jgi:hypothetical protein
MLGFGLSALAEFIPLPENQFVDFGIIAILLPWNVITVLILIFGKKYITIPRLGFVKFGEKRKKIKKRLLIFLIINVVVAFVLLFFRISGIFSSLQLNTSIESLIIGILFITLPFSVFAFFLDFYRLFFYAILSGLGFFFTELIYPLVGEPYDVLLSFGAIGIIITTIGLIYLVQFLLKYPLSEK